MLSLAAIGEGQLEKRRRKERESNIVVDPEVIANWIRNAKRNNDNQNDIEDAEVVE